MVCLTIGNAAATSYSYSVSIENRGESPVRVVYSQHDTEAEARSIASKPFDHHYDSRIEIVDIKPRESARMKATESLPWIRWCITVPESAARCGVIHIRGGKGLFFE